MQVLNSFDYSSSDTTSVQRFVVLQKALLHKEYELRGKIP